MAIYSEFSHENWWFSIVFLYVYQRVVVKETNGSTKIMLIHVDPLFGAKCCGFTFFLTWCLRIFVMVGQMLAKCLKNLVDVAAGPTSTCQLCFRDVEWGIWDWKHYWPCGRFLKNALCTRVGLNQELGNKSYTSWYDAPATLRKPCCHLSGYLIQLCSGTQKNISWLSNSPAIFCRTSGRTGAIFWPSLGAISLPIRSKCSRFARWTCHERPIRDLSSGWASSS